MRDAMANLLPSMISTGLALSRSSQRTLSRTLTTDHYHDAENQDIHQTTRLDSKSSGCVQCSPTPSDTRFLGEIEFLQQNLQQTFSCRGRIYPARSRILSKQGEVKLRKPACET